MNPVIMKKLAKPLLFFAAFIWGMSFFVMKNTLDSIPVFWLLTFRFAVGGLLLGLVCSFIWHPKLTKDDVWRGGLLGILLFLAYSVQTFGLVYTTPSNNAFLTTVYCVLVPFLYWGISHQKPDRFHLMAALFCVVGVGLVSITGQFTIAIGDSLTLLCALFYALHIVAVNHLSDGKNIYVLTAVQFTVVALCSAIGGMLTQPFPIHVFTDSSMIFPLFYLCVLATTVALLFQNVGQVWSDPSSASVILSLESVFGVLFSVVFYGDPVTPRLLLGFGFIFFAVLCSETKFSFLQKKKTPNSCSCNTL